MKVVRNVWIQPAPIRRNVVVLLGGPGSGKGTQARAIGEWLNSPHVSSGELLRREAAAATPLGLRAKPIVDSGGLVNDELMDELVMNRLRNPDCSNGVILDGYPRNVRQAITLEGNLPMSDRQIVIDLIADPDEIIPRLANRRTCTSCGAIYHLAVSPPRVAGVCDDCGGTVTQRSDDREDVVRKRFTAYQVACERLTRLYKRMGVYHAVNAMRPADQISREVRQLLEHAIFESPSPERVAADRRGTSFACSTEEVS